MYCVYLTIYSGNKLPPFYIGSKDINPILSQKYRGSVISKEYSLIWKQELKENPHLFKFNPKSKLSKNEIIELHKSGKSFTEIGKLANISRQRAHQIFCS